MKIDLIFHTSFRFSGNPIFIFLFSDILYLFLEATRSFYWIYYRWNISKGYNCRLLCWMWKITGIRKSFNSVRWYSAFLISYVCGITGGHHYRNRNRIGDNLHSFFAVYSFRNFIFMYSTTVAPLGSIYKTM